MEWLFQYDFDRLTTIALWSIAAVLVTTILLFVYTITLRLATVASNRRRRKFLVNWRDIFAMAILDSDIVRTQSFPPVRRNDRIDMLEEWNRARSIVAGQSVENMILLGHRIGVPAMTMELFQSRRLRARILAVQTIGHLRENSYRDKVRELLEHHNAVFSITAAGALVEIDPEFAVSVIIPMLDKRRDWPRNRISILLHKAGSERISEPLCRAIRSADNESKIYLLQFARLIETKILDAIVCDLIREGRDPGVLNASLKLVSSFANVPRIAALTRHRAWFVRMQAARVLGRVGQKEQLSLLEALLGDPEWWVRYRAAQAITALPFLGPNQLRKLRLRQDDRFAVDILQHTYAEAGLA